MPLPTQVPRSVITLTFYPLHKKERIRHTTQDEESMELVLDAEYMAGNTLEETTAEWLLDNIPKKALNKKLSCPALEFTHP